MPWVISGWALAPTWPWPLRVLGVIMIGVGLVGLLAAFAQFVLEGRGTPAPVAPTEQLVIRGLYRYVRNPMYLSVGAILLGQAVLLPSIVLLLWTTLFAAAVFGFVHFYEQPSLRERYGQHYAAYCRAVPAWWPRLTPYHGEKSGG